MGCEGKLRFRDAASGQLLLTPGELASDRLAAHERAEEERANRMAAESRLSELEAELRRLHGE